MIRRIITGNLPVLTKNTSQIAARNKNHAGSVIAADRRFLAGMQAGKGDPQLRVFPAIACGGGSMRQPVNAAGAGAKAAVFIQATDIHD